MQTRNIPRSRSQNIREGSESQLQTSMPTTKRIVNYFKVYPQESAYFSGQQYSGV